VNLDTPEFLESSESLEKSPESLDCHLCSGICALPKTGATGFANLVPPVLQIWCHRVCVAVTPSSSSSSCLLVWLELKLGVGLKDQFLDEYRVPALHKH
jgi:hypothetical protein